MLRHRSYAGGLLALLLRLGSVGGPLLTADELIPNGDFENGLSGWLNLWTREVQAGQVTLETNGVHHGKAAARVEHRGGRDWSLSQGRQLRVEPGEMFALGAWIKVEGTGDATIGVVTRNGAGEVLDWLHGGRELRGPSEWRQLRSRFVIPPGAATIEPRLIGARPATIWVDDLSLAKKGNVAELRGKGLPERISLTNAIIVVTVHLADAALLVTDRRTQQTWTQQTRAAEVVLTGARLVADAQSARSGPALELNLLHLPSGLDLRTTLQLEADLPELTVTLAAEGELLGAIGFPHPFVTTPGTHLIIPMNEGISYPVVDKSISPMRLIAYGGHGICMAFWGVTDGERGQMAILETPDDAAIRVDRLAVNSGTLGTPELAGNLVIAPEWEAQKGQFGYPRRLRYVFFDHGGYGAMCKRYRAYAQTIGRFKTLEQKRRENPNVDQLIGAVNVWCWEREALALARELKSLGIGRILWSNRQSPETLRAMNELGILTSRYDIYQDVMDPDNFKFLHGVHTDWTTAAWPKDIARDVHGDWRRGWEVQGTNGVWYPCGIICDRQALTYARGRIPPELATHPYRCRFIDTTTAAPWHECYATNHPMTRGESRQWKMELLRYVAEDLKLVTGCETGHDAAVPYLHYFEGMLSLGPYRVPDAGRDMLRIWTEVPAEVAKFQLGHAYRLPLWELVYHDCVVAQWYWGDYNNKLPALWDKRDLFNVLYGTPPMFMFNRQIWERNRARFVQSYQNVCPVARAVGYAEMTAHRFLTPDRDVQKTQFANGVTVTVNFGGTPYRLAGGKEIAGMGFDVTGIIAEKGSEENKR